MAFTRNIRITRHGIRMHDIDLTLVDDKNRSIEVGPASGLLARDAGGTIIHDIPDAPVLTDMVYGGHVIWDTSPAYMATLSLSYTDTETSRSATSSIQNTNVSSYLPNGLSNVRGLLAYFEVAQNVLSAKRQDSTYVYVYIRYSLKYNTAPSNHQKLIYRDPPRVNNTSDYIVWSGFQCFIPVVYNGSTPYVTWNLTGIWNSMTSSNSTYSATAYLYYQGVLV